MSAERAVHSGTARRLPASWLVARIDSEQVEQHVQDNRDDDRDDEREEETAGRAPKDLNPTACKALRSKQRSHALNPLLLRLDAWSICAIDAIDINAANLRLAAAQAGQASETQEAEQAPVIEPAVFLFLGCLRGLRRLGGGLLRERRTGRQQAEEQRQSKRARS